MTDLAFRLDGFRVDFPDFRLGPLGCEARHGERIALVGPNGAGKTTLMRTLAGLLPSYGGVAEVLGKSVGSWGPDLRNHVGILHERLHGFGWMTVTEHLRFLGAVLQGWDADYAAQLRGQLSLPERTKLANLSKGMQVKLGLVAAEAFRPRLLLLDEPTSGIDPVMRREVLDLVCACAPPGSGRTIVFSTHILEDVESVAERVVLLRRGQIIGDETISALREEGGERTVSAAIYRRLT